MRRTLASTAAVAVASALVLAALTVAFVAWLTPPEDLVSYPTGRCVEVKDYKAEHEGRKSEWSCDRLPDAYDLVWVY